LHEYFHHRTLSNSTVEKIQTHFVFIIIIYSCWCCCWVSSSWALSTVVVIVGGSYPSISKPQIPFILLPRAAARHQFTAQFFARWLATIATSDGDIYFASSDEGCCCCCSLSASLLLGDRMAASSRVSEERQMPPLLLMTCCCCPTLPGICRCCCCCPAVSAMLLLLFAGGMGSGSPAAGRFPCRGPGWRGGRPPPPPFWFKHHRNRCRDCSQRQHDHSRCSYCSRRQQLQTVPIVIVVVVRHVGSVGLVRPGERGMRYSMAKAENRGCVRTKGKDASRPRAGRCRFRRLKRQRNEGGATAPHHRLLRRRRRQQQQGSTNSPTVVCYNKNKLDNWESASAKRNREASCFLRLLFFLFWLTTTSSIWGGKFPCVCCCSLFVVVARSSLSRSC